MKLKRICAVIASVFVLGFAIIETTSSINADDYANNVEIVQPEQVIGLNSTSYGNAGITKLEIQANGRRVWWYAKPYQSGGFSYKGVITVYDSKGIPAVYYVSGDGSGSVSGSVSLRYKAKKATMTGVCYGSNGIAITMPFSDSAYGG